jgi:hypothetical protein
LNRNRKRKVDGRAAPSRNDEYLLYQTLIGPFPTGNVDRSALTAYRERVDAYMQEGRSRSEGAHQLDQSQRRLRVGGGGIRAPAAQR